MTNEIRLVNDEILSLFNDRPERKSACPRCCGVGSIVEPYLLRPWGASLPGAPEGAISACVVGSASIFEVTREAAEIARRAQAPVVFSFIDKLVVVNPGDDSDQMSRAWWQDRYGETPERTLARR